MKLKKIAKIMLILFVVSMCAGYVSYEVLEEYTAATLEENKNEGD